MSFYYSDDPVMDAERHIKNLDKQREQHRIGRCAECGEDIYDYDDRYELDGDIIHDDCILDWIAQFKKRGSTERKY